jgi:hypothetical protein
MTYHYGSIIIYRKKILFDCRPENLEDSERFFTSQEIELLLRMENIHVLGLDDVPDYATMFYKSRRIRKPNNRSRR